LRSDRGLERQGAGNRISEGECSFRPRRDFTGKTEIGHRGVKLLTRRSGIRFYYMTTFYKRNRSTWIVKACLASRREMNMKRQSQKPVLQGSRCVLLLLSVYLGDKGQEFCTSVHRFAQLCDQNLIDGADNYIYLAPQIEPGSLRTLRINLEGAARLNIGCAARLNREARSLNGFVWRAGPA